MPAALTEKTADPLIESASWAAAIVTAWATFQLAGVNVSVAGVRRQVGVAGLAGDGDDDVRRRLLRELHRERRLPALGDRRAASA